MPANPVPPLSTGLNAASWAPTAPTNCRKIAVKVAVKAVTRAKPSNVALIEDAGTFVTRIESHPRPVYLAGQDGISSLNRWRPGERWKQDFCRLVYESLILAFLPITPRSQAVYAVRGRRALRPTKSAILYFLYPAPITWG